MNSRRKLFISVILSAVCVFFFIMSTIIVNKLIFADKVRVRDTEKLDAINRMMDDLSSSLTEAEQKAIRQYEVNAVLTATALKNVVSDTRDDSTTALRNGAFRIGAGCHRRNRKHSSLYGR